MARRFNKVALLALAIATLVQCSTAQTTHVVGDALAWVVPPNGATAYSDWAANQTFIVGDILMFNFASGRHDVAEVTASSFSACNTASPISAQTNSPANFTLTTAGEHYYICRFPGHCSGGQKLSINVSAAASSPAPQPSSPAPQPSSPSPPVSAPTPTPTTAPSPTPTTTPSPTPTSAPAPTPTSTTAPPSTPTPTSPPSTTTPTATPPSGVTSPPPPDSSAKSLGVAGLFTTFFAILVALLY